MRVAVQADGMRGSGGRRVAITRSLCCGGIIPSHLRRAGMKRPRRFFNFAAIESPLAALQVRSFGAARRLEFARGQRRAAARDLQNILAPTEPPSCPSSGFRGAIRPVDIHGFPGSIWGLRHCSNRSTARG
jgi:hypothetical protein